MPPQKAHETAVDGLKKILSDIAQVSILPDADPQFIQQLQQMVVDHLKQMGSQQNTPGGMAGPAGPPPPGGPPGMAPPGAGSPPPGMMTGGAQPGLNIGGQDGMPNMDELSRMLQSGAGAS